MAESTTRFRQQLLGRMLLFVALPTALILALVISLAIWRGFSNLRRASEQYLRSEALLNATKIRDQNRQAITAATLMADAQAAGMFGDREASIEYARRVLEHMPEFTAAYIGYEPNADGKDQDSLGSLAAEAMDDAGRFIPYWFLSTAKVDRIELEPMVDMETSLYYQGVKDAFAASGKAEAMITEPYVYQGKMIVEQTFPIVIDGRFAGVAGVDRALSDVESDLRRRAARMEADLFLISSRGKFIAATTDPEGDVTAGSASVLKTAVVSDSPYAELFGPLTRSAAGQKLVRDVDPTDDEKYYFVASSVETGGWTLIVRKSEAAILAPIWQQMRVGVILASLGILVVVTLLVLNIYKVSRRVKMAAAAADRIAAGDLSGQLDTVTSPDETGVLVRAICTMTGNLNDLVGKVKHASIQLNSTATELAATSRQQEATVNTFGASANQIAAAVNEISATSGELVKTMEQVSSVASGTANLASSGREELQSMETTMVGLGDATTSIADKLAVINEKATDITGVVTTITKVADQTNLLSVNAAIEAEKAGEYGVGFLVVAREIRRLADQTAGATLDIERMVQGMQSAVATGVMEMDRFADQVRRTVGDVSTISHQMAQIIEQVNANVASFAQVNEGMQSQAMGAEQIGEAMSQLTSGATQTMDSIREYAHAAEDLQGAISSLKSSIATFHLEGAR